MYIRLCQLCRNIVKQAAGWVDARLYIGTAGPALNGNVTQRVGGAGPGRHRRIVYCVFSVTRQ
jgi:hypothetical protein